MSRGSSQQWFLVGTVVALSLSLSACGIIKPTRQRRGDAVKSGFLGDYSKLAPRDGYDAQEIYINPQTQWAKYDAVYIESATLWAKSESATKLSKEDQKMLTDMLYSSVSSKLAEKFRVVHEPGVGVIKVRIALTEAEGANVPLNVVSTIVPQIRTAATLVGVGADTAMVVGSARAEMEARDSITNERLAAGVDGRAGTKGITRAFSKWADVQAIVDYWAEHMQGFLVKQGVQQKAGAKK